MKKDVLQLIGLIIVVVFLVVLIYAISAYLLQLLWNWLLVELFGLTTITFIQAFGLILLLSIIGSFFKNNN